MIQARRNAHKSPTMLITLVKAKEIVISVRPILVVLKIVIILTSLMPNPPGDPGVI